MLRLSEQEPLQGIKIQITSNTNTKLLHHLDLILKEYIQDRVSRKTIKLNILKQFSNQSSHSYRLDDSTSLILLKDHRKLKRLSKYDNSPFPFLKNVVYFSTSVGEWNTELEAYGIRCRAKYEEPCSSNSISSRIHLVRLDTISSRGNRYLQRQYKELERSRVTKDYCSY